MIHIVDSIAPNQFYSYFFGVMNFNDWAICYKEKMIVFRQECDPNFDTPQYCTEKHSAYITAFIIKSYEEAIEKIENIEIDFIFYNKNINLSLQQINYLEFLKKVI